MISRACSYDTLIHTNKLNASIDVQVNCDQVISFGSRKSCNEIIIDFGWNANYGIRVNPSRTIGSIGPHITSLNSGTELRMIGFGRNSNDGIPSINIGIFYLFNGGKSDLSDRSASWLGEAKSESENPGGEIIFKNAGRDNSLKLKKLDAKIL